MKRFFTDKDAIMARLAAKARRESEEHLAFMGLVRKAIEVIRQEETMRCGSEYQPKTL